MCRTETSGRIVRNSSIITRRTLRLAVIPLSLGLVATSGAARAQQSDDRSFSEKIMESFYGTIRGTNMDNRGIDYRERSPLVVPPTLDLPPPAASAGHVGIANWPKDPDERKRKAIIAEKKKNAPPPARVRVSTDGAGGVAPAAQPINIAPPVEEQPVPGATRPAATSIMSREATDPVNDKAGDLLSGGAAAISDALGTSSLFGTGKQTVAVQPGTEPVREALTQPPAGYQVPSPNYAYGLEPKGLLDGRANPDRNPLAERSSATSVVH